MRNRVVGVGVWAAACLMLSGCGGMMVEVALPPAGAVFDYQLGGASPVPDGVTVVARDSTEKPAPGVYGICYINGFQTQPGAEWPAQWLARSGDGALLVDENWPDEHIFDLSTSGNREAIAAQLGETIAACAASGFDAVEFDNLDSYTRSQGAFDLDAAADYATRLVALAHGAGLAAAQKNTGELGLRGRDDIGFDFAVTEECDRFDECDTFTDVYGARVFDIEYTDDLRDTIAGACLRASAIDPRPSVIVRDRGLAPADDAAYEFTACSLA